MPRNRIKTSRRGQPAGMTFTEVLVAAALLAFAMVPILRAMTGNHLFLTQIERKSTCLLLAQNQIEQLRARAIEDDFESPWSVSSADMGRGYFCTVTVDLDASLRTVTAEAGFDRDGDRHLDSDEVLITLRTKIAKLK